MKPEFRERYEYSLDSRQLGIVLLGVTVLAALVFVLGVSVGIQWQKRSGTDVAQVTEATGGTEENQPGTELPAAPAVDPGYSESRDDKGSVEDDKEAERKDGDVSGIQTEKLTFPKTLTAKEAAAPKPRPKPKETSAKKESAEKAPAADAGGVYTVQVGAFKELDSAKKLVERLKKDGFKAEYRRAGGSTGLYKVRVGSFASLAEARGTAAKLESKEGLKPYVTSY